MLHRYTGLTPSDVSRDAKYSVVSGSDGDEIRLIYHISSREYFLLTTAQHPRLVEMVNAVKIELSGQPRGVFYINEFRDVLVPDGHGGSYWAGNYEKNLEFEYEDEDGIKIIGPKAPDGLLLGDTWLGPHVGVRYILGVRGIRYESQTGPRVQKVFLTDHVDDDAARQLTQRLMGIMGSTGRFYINECGELFAPARAADGTSPIYLGNLDDDLWFSPPDGFDRP
jgi:hypothetical protein